ncbi:acyl-CoA dehydrogenase family protein [Sphingobium sp. HBC34]|uniref:Acyl-CoA dehydrogenase family protein n=1 Tax=Sphingobium cyanobacteriorum TaxID=3063954 RepID=A0ABT8ZPC6_9SPHN|nr:acyl-CoA dehydrogenase family protein [Sphingobium sp. HBC34]MDO7836389.1 acyl-CoA dehydrogenase family protein [Sphingobium sp. HBC34]
MDFQFDDNLVEFRQMVREAVKQDLPADIREGQRRFGGNQSDPHDSLTWTKILAKRGWSVPHWPVEYGGQNWSPMQLFVFQDELTRAFAPDTCWGGTHMCGPVIYTFGSEAQKERFLPAIINGDFYWAQGFSEPGNGSDLANLRTSATRKGDVYVVNGQKIWTSCAWMAEWGFFLVRTDPTVKPQRGISFLLINMKSPGITVRRIPQINGEAELCEVFLDNVEVPVENMVGEEGAGWTYAKFLLDHERTTSSFIYFNKRDLRIAQDIAANQMLDGVPLSKHPRFQGRLAQLEAEVTALEWSVLRVLANEQFQYNETAAASVLKVAGSRLQQTISELHLDLLGAQSIRQFPFEVHDRPNSPLWPDVTENANQRALIQRASTIYGGTMQVQKNIIAKLAFDL